MITSPARSRKNPQRRLWRLSNASMMPASPLDSRTAVQEVAVEMQVPVDVVETVEENPPAVLDVAVEHHNNPSST